RRISASTTKRRLGCRRAQNSKTRIPICSASETLSTRTGHRIPVVGILFASETWNLTNPVLPAFAECRNLRFQGKLYILAAANGRLKGSKSGSASTGKDGFLAGILRFLERSGARDLAFAWRTNC